MKSIKKNSTHFHVTHELKHVSVSMHLRKKKSSSATSVRGRAISFLSEKDLPENLLLVTEYK